VPFYLYSLRNTCSVRSAAHVSCDTHTHTSHEAQEAYAYASEASHHTSHDSQRPRSWSIPLPVPVRAVVARLLMCASHERERTHGPGTQRWKGRMHQRRCNPRTARWLHTTRFTRLVQNNALAESDLRGCIASVLSTPKTRCGLPNMARCGLPHGPCPHPPSPFFVPPVTGMSVLPSAPPLLPASQMPPCRGPPMST